MQFKLLQRDFSSPLTMPELAFTVQRLSNRQPGGPDQATITATGSERALFELAEWMQCPVEIYDDHNDPAWWGYLDTLEITVGAIRLAVRMGQVFNRVAVVYSYVAPGSTTVGTRATTTWVQDDDSIGLYGVHELLLSISGATAAQAEAARDAALAMYKLPTTTVEVNPGGGTNGATLTCSGWWKSLAWRYFGESCISSVETTTQIAAMVTEEGEYLTGTLIENASGISSSEYRQGDQSALFWISELLASGTSNGRRLLAEVNRWRELRIWEMPERSGDNAEIFIRSDGRVEGRYGVDVLAQHAPVGVWGLLKDVIPSSLDTSKIADPGLFFIEQAEYDAVTGVYRPIVTGAWNFGSEITEG